MHALVEVDGSPRPEQAIERAAERLAGQLAGSPADGPAGARPSGAAPGCDLALLFATSSHGALERDAAEALGRALGAREVAAAQVGGLLAPGHERVGLPGVGIVALRGGSRVHAVDDARGREAEVGEELAHALGPFDAAGRDALLVVACAGELDARALVRGLAACAPARVLGAGVEGPGGGAATIVANGERVRGGVLGVRVRGGAPPAVELAPGVRLGPPLRVGRASGHWVHELEGASALEELRDAAGALWDDERRALRSVLVALPPPPCADAACASHAAQAGSALEAAPHPAHVRAIVGIDAAAGAIALPEPVREGSLLAFAHRDALAARDALSAAAERLREAPRAAPAALGLALSCARRGTALFGEDGLEAAYLARAFGAAPWLGLVGAWQVGPAPCGGAGPAAAALHPSLMTHTGVLAALGGAEPDPLQPDGGPW
ncbi:MAG: FIST C-terminal domain-containing protein [Myxococcota bacterium]